MKTITRGWPPARRAAQAQNIQKIRPWLKATGPKTARGKAIASQNARKSGSKDPQMRFVAAVLYAQRKFRRLIKPLMNNTLTTLEYRYLKHAIEASSAYKDLQSFIKQALAKWRQSQYAFGYAHAA